MHIAQLDEIKSKKIYFIKDTTNLIKLYSLKKTIMSEDIFILIYQINNSKKIEKFCKKNNFNFGYFDWVELSGTWINNVNSSISENIKTIKQILKSDRKVINFISSIYKTKLVYKPIIKSLLKESQQEKSFEKAFTYLESININIQKIQNYYFLEYLKLSVKKSFLPFLIINYPLYVLMRFRNFSKKQNTKIDIAYSVREKSFDLNTNPKINWINDVLKNKNINTLFFSNEYSGKLIDNFKNEKHLLISYFKPYNYFSFKSLTFLLKLYFLILKNFYIFMRSNNKIHKIIFLSLYNYINWNLISSDYSISNFIDYNNFHENHFFRNIILNQNGTSTLIYKHTNSEIVFDKSLYQNFFNVNMLYPFYDTELHWTKSSLELSLINKSLSKNKFIIGPLWVKEKLVNKSKDNLNISFFTSKFGSTGAVNSINSHIKFLEFIFEICQKYPSNNYYLKPKYDFDRINTQNLNLLNISKDLKNLNNLNIIREDLSTELIKKSDLIISMPFVSSNLQAISMNVNSVYLDLMGHYPNNIFCNYKNFYINSKENFYGIYDSFLTKSHNDRSTENQYLLNDFIGSGNFDSEKQNKLINEIIKI